MSSHKGLLLPRTREPWIRGKEITLALRIRPALDPDEIVGSTDESRERARSRSCTIWVKHS
jgi:hypothetical protein